MKYQYFISFLFIFLQYIFINKYLYGYSYPHHFGFKQEKYFLNELKYLFYQPRTHGSNALNTTITFLNDIINKFYHNSNYTDLIQFFPHKYSSPYIASTNSFNIYTIHNDVNTSIFYFHKTNNSSDIINYSAGAKNSRKNRRKNLIQDKKIFKDIYYHNNSKPLIIICKVDTNPLRASTFDTSIHIFAITDAIETILNSKQIIDKINHDFAFVFTGCEEFEQLGTKNIIKNAFKDGGYYLYLSGFGVGRPLALLSQSNKSSSVLKALSKVSYIPMATFTSELEDFISLVKAKSFSMTKVKQQTAPKNDHKSKAAFNSDTNIESKINSFNLNFLKKQGFENEFHKYKYRYHFVNGASKIQKNQKFAGSELSFIGNPLIHSTASDMDSDVHNFKNVQLVVHSILQFLMNFDTKSTENDISKETYTVAFGISPFVILIQKETLNLLSFFLILSFCIYIVFYLIIQIYHKWNENGSHIKNESIKRAEIFKSIYFVLKDEFSFILCYFSALALTFICYLIFFLLLSVMNTSVIIFKPNLYLFLIAFSIFTAFICIFEHLINCFKRKKSSSDQFNVAYFYLDDDWHFLQVIYITLLLIIFKKFDFEILFVLTAIFFIIYQFCPVHKGLVWTPAFLSIFMLCPLIFTYALLYRPFLLDCQNLPIFYADIVPFIFIFLFFTHISVFILPFYYAKEKLNQSTESQSNPERIKIHYLCAISQLFYAFNKIDNISSTSKIENSEEDKKSNDKKAESSNAIKNKNKTNKKELATANVQNNSNNESLLSSFKNAIEASISSKKLIIVNSFILFFLLFFNSPSFNNEIPIKGTFAHYYYLNSNKSEISFIPQNGRRSVPFLWKSLSKNANISYVFNYKGRLLTDPRPAFVKTVENSSLPFFFTTWPQISLSSIQHDVPNKRRAAVFNNDNDDEDDETKKVDKKPKIVRKILFNLHSIGPNINFIYFIFKCGKYLNDGQCVDNRIRLVDPIDQSTIFYLNSQKNKEKLFIPFFSDNGETVFRIGSFVGNQIRRIPQIEINVTVNTPIKLTIVYQSFIETKEMKDFQSKFNKVAVNEINANEVTQSVFIQTQMI